MNINMTADVIQASRYDMDGNKGASIYATQKTDGSNPDRAGLELMKLTCDYGVVDLLRDFLPCKCEIVAQPTQGAGQKMAFKVVSIKPLTAKAAA
ncbi:hypothetical protein CLV44_11612 [Marinobacterium halophilum]|uniref:Uncharacterized protein n=1 Tax=Marinobacterium halophilum TaxID=267374 RepID=A0A2P8ET73_9GAMM|nr:hypothetical protein [Marinobacterium halophilum]PSL12654.1 hypothetical protein CLV44_11612 [Marinobacterium halophilum]